ncbi:hypothetical protein MYX77_08815 [Acidobacteriia bacterium AH_259_A11_L15]|nr:hypothetical protein [Acidobacteriia bacterium AH_259_A11_L15]
MGGPDDKDETLSPKPEESERTTPFGTPESSQATTDLDPSAPALRPLTERYDLNRFAVVGAAALVAFRARIVSALQQKKAEFE